MVMLSKIKFALWLVIILIGIWFFLTLGIAIFIVASIIALIILLFLLFSSRVKIKRMKIK